MIDAPDTVVNIYLHPVHHLFIACSMLVQCLFSTCSMLVQHLFNTCSAPVLHAFDVCGTGAESLTPVLVVLPPRGFVFPSKPLRRLRGRTALQADTEGGGHYPGALPPVTHSIALQAKIFLLHR